MLTSRSLFRVGLLLALLVLPLWATLDQDGDGMSDVWSELYPSAVPPEADTDGDGATNRAESVAGTDPTSAANRFAAISQRDPSGNLVLRWQGIVGKRYVIESSTDLRTWIPELSERIGTGAEIEVIVRPAGSTGPAREFWRVAVSDIDTDSDGLNDWEEAQLGTDPTRADTDDDGLPDAWEVTYGLNPLVDDAAGNLDNDAFTNAEEFATGMNPAGVPIPDTTGAVALTIFSITL